MKQLKINLLSCLPQGLKRSNSEREVHNENVKDMTGTKRACVLFPFICIIVGLKEPTSSFASSFANFNEKDFGMNKYDDEGGEPKRDTKQNQLTHTHRV